MRKLGPLTVGDLMYAFCNLRPDEWDTIHRFLGMVTIDQMIIRCYNYPGPKWRYGDENKTAIVGGFIPQRNGVFQSWFFSTQDAWAEIGKEVTDVAMERKRALFDDGAHRIETVCLASNTLAQRWYRTIGFKYEATLSAYCVDGSDAALYADTHRRQ